MTDPALPAGLSQRADVARAVRAQPGSRLGDRLRQLRVAAGMTQTELAADRFSKEYISQIERGKTRPTAETVEWLAARLGVDATFLASGVSSDERARAEAMLARAEALVERLEFDGAIDEYATRARRRSSRPARVELQRARCSPARPGRAMHNGEVRAGIDLLDRARGARRGAGVLRHRPRRGRSSGSASAAT